MLLNYPHKKVIQLHQNVLFIRKLFMWNGFFSIWLAAVDLNSIYSRGFKINLFNGGLSVEFAFN